jgi:hypothetical protein
MSDDPAHDYEILRVSTAQMLGLDLANLSPAEGLRLDLTVLLRLQLDALQGLALAGQDIDLSRLQSCYVMLSKLLPQAVEAPPEVHEDHDVRAKVAKLLRGFEEARLFEEAESDERLLEALAADALADVMLSPTANVAVDAATPTPPPPPPPPPPQQKQTSPQPPLALVSSSAPYVRRGDGVVEGGRFGHWDRWSNRN